MTSRHCLSIKPIQLDRDKIMKIVVTQGKPQTHKTCRDKRHRKDRDEDIGKFSYSLTFNLLEGFPVSGPQLSINEIR